MQKRLGIIIGLKDEASKGLKSLGDNTKEFGKKLVTGLASVAGLAVGAATAIKKLTDEAAKYNLAMLDSATATGIGVEEFSRIVQVGDDFRVSQEAMTKALEMATKNGFSPTVANLAELSDHLLTITDPTERAAEASKIFGKNWADIAPFLLQGGDAIKKNTKAISDNLVVTRAEAKASQQYFETMDTLNDTIQGFSIALGNMAGPAVIEFVGFMQKGIVAGDQFVKILGWILQGEDSVLYKQTIMAAKSKESDDWYGTHQGFYDYYTKGAGAAKEAAQATEGLTEKQLIQMAAEALLAGDTLLAQHYMDAAREASNQADALQRMIDYLTILSEGDWKIKIGYTDSPAPSGYVAPAAEGGGEGYHHRAWREQHPSGMDSEGRGNPYDYGYALGGEFEVGGPAGVDKAMVRFRASAGEKVKITPQGGGDERLYHELQQTRRAMDRLARTLPVIMRDAVERAQ